MADDDDLVVTISGPAFSMMLFENTRIHDQIGFLLGEILIYVSTKVTDSDRDVEHTTQHINIKHVVSYPLGEPFYNGNGQIKEDKVRALLGKNLNKIVGWYHYRQNFRLDTSLRDINIHNHLLKLVSHENSLLSSECFVLCLLNSSVNETGGTHKFKHQLLHKPNKVFKPVPLKITNLGADATRPDGSDHKPAPKLSSSDSDAFDQIYERVKNDLSRASGVQAVTLIESAAGALLNEMSSELSKSDKEISELEMKLTKLRNELYQKQFEKFTPLRLAPLEEQMQKMEVDFKPFVTQSPRSPSPEIFEGPKSSKQSTSTDQYKKSKSSRVASFQKSMQKMDVDLKSHFRSSSPVFGNSKSLRSSTIKTGMHDASSEQNSQDISLDLSPKSDDSSNAKEASQSQDSIDF